MVTTDTTSDRQVAVLIDFENVGLGSIRWLFDQISDVGRIVVRRAYADWSTSGRTQRDQLLELGIEPVHLFHAASRKNSSDIRLAIDAVELLYQSSVDTFVVVSSDTDFVPLVSKLRAAGKTVIGAGRRMAAGETLVISCDRFYNLDQAEKAAATPAARSDVGESLLTRAVKAAMDAQGKVIGSKVIQTLQRLDPGFDYRAQGHSTFTRFLEASSEVTVSRPRGGDDVIVELVSLEAEPAPQRPVRRQAERRVEAAPAAAAPPANSADVHEADPNVWGPSVNTAWSQRASEPGQTISGSAAAAAAAQSLGYSKLSISPYKTLRRLLESSELLSAQWRQEMGKLVRK